MLSLRFSGRIWFWRGPAPWYFVTVPRKQSLALQALSPALTYGWGVIPVTAQIKNTRWTTSLFPKDGLYALPIKAVVRKAEDLDEGDRVVVEMTTTDPR
jgi:hypothetical protein